MGKGWVRHGRARFGGVRLAAVGRGVVRSGAVRHASVWYGMVLIMNKRPKRKAIPVSAKCEVLRRQRANCTECKQPLWPSDPVEYDHRPPLILRAVNAAGTDYVPPQNDPDHIEALHTSCHLKRTVGRKPNAAKTSTTLGSDVWLAKKFRRLEGRPRRKAAIPQRRNPWPKRGFGK